MHRTDLQRRLALGWFEFFAAIVCLTLLLLPVATSAQTPDFMIIQTPYPTVHSEILETDTAFGIRGVFPDPNNYGHSRGRQIFGVKFNGTLVLSLETYEAITPDSNPASHLVGWIKVQVGDRQLLLPAFAPK
jgi:hypothetical protein